MASYQTSASSEIRFSLMAVVKNRLKVYEEQVRQIEENVAQAQANTALRGTAELDALVSHKLAEKDELTMCMAQEHAKFEGFKVSEI
jgi:uncharacterized protein YdcH (DUF465 family)